MADYHSFVNVPYPALGLIIPQKVYKDDRQYQIRPTVIFPGSITIQEALGMPNRSRRGYEVLTATTNHDRARFTLRLNMPGYGPKSIVINARERNEEAQPIPLWLLARRVAEAVKKFLEELRNEQGTESGWLVTRMSLDKLILLELRHVSEGSWQPVLTWDTD